MVDIELSGTVKQAMAGDQHAWDLLVERFSGLVWNVARSQSLDVSDAADVSQTVWLRLAEHIAELRDPERVGAWLATTTRNEAQRVRRRRHYQVPTSDERLMRLPEINLRQPEAAVEAAEESEMLWRAFAALGEACRVLLRMLISDPRPSYAMVSETLGVPVGSIGPTRSRCLTNLRAQVEAVAFAPAASDGIRRVTGVFDSDDLLMAELEALAARFDPVPAEVLVGARAAYTSGAAWDTALAELVFDSTTDPDDTRALVRGGAAVRELTFEGPELTIEVEIGVEEPARSGRLRILGQLVPATAASIEVRRANGSTTIKADDLGRFALDSAPTGPISLRCTPNGAATTTTEWILI